MSSEPNDFDVMQMSRRRDEQGNSIPHGYILPNGVVVVYRDGGQACNNYTNEAFARAAFPNLVIVR